MTAEHPSAIDNYRKHKRSNHTRPLDNIAFAKLENIAPPDYNKLLQDVRAVLPGNAGATQYEDAIEKLLSALLYPSLASPLKQHEIHDGRKRIDITYSNVAQAGFFDWIGRRYPAANVFVECKNYGKDVGNPEVDQLAGRFSPSRGQFGLLVVRSVANKALLDRRCKDTSNDSRGFIICLDDNDLQDLIKQRESIINGYNDNLLWRRFQKLIS